MITWEDMSSYNKVKLPQLLVIDSQKEEITITWEDMSSYNKVKP